jgi:hypothetical protein
LDNIRTKSHKYMKGLEKIYFRPKTDLQQYEYDAASQIFHDLRCAFKEDFFTGSLIQLDEETVEQGFWLWIRKMALGQTGYVH